MDIKKILTENNIKIKDGNKISKADYDKAIKVLSSKTSASASELVLDPNGNTHNKAEETYSSEFTVVFDLKKSFAKEVKENVSVNPDVQLEDLHELYENLDYVNNEFASLKLDDLIWKSVRNVLNEIDIQSVETSLIFYASDLPKVEEFSFEADLKKMIENVGKLEATLTITINYGLSFTEIMEKCRVIAEKALKGADI